MGEAYALSSFVENQLRQVMGEDVRRLELMKEGSREETKVGSGARCKRGWTDLSVAQGVGLILH